MASVACAGCGVSVECSPKTKPKKWCSGACRARAYYARPEYRQRQSDAAKERAQRRRVFKACLSCGGRKLSNKGDYCSAKPECRRASWQAHRARYAACAADGCDRPTQGRGFCSTHYQRWWRENNRDRARARARKGNSLRKALVAGATVEAVDPQRVFELDGWRCHLCGRKIDRRLRWPHVKSASLDHVVPLSKGGAHSYENCRASHYGCNAAKCNRGDGEQFVFAVS